MNFSMSCIDKVSPFEVNWIWFAWIKTKDFRESLLTKSAKEHVSNTILLTGLRTIARMTAHGRKADLIDSKCNVNFVSSLPLHGCKSCSLLQLDSFGVCFNAIKLFGRYFYGLLSTYQFSCKTNKNISFHVTFF